MLKSIPHTIAFLLLLVVALFGPLAFLPVTSAEGKGPTPTTTPSGGELPAPTNLTFTASPTTIQLDWEYADMANIEGFDIYINTDEMWWIDYVFDSTTYTAEHLFCGQSVTYGVQAYGYDEENDEYLSSEIVSIEASTGDCADIPLVADLTLEQVAEGATPQIKLSWSPYSEPDSIVSFDILSFEPYSPVPYYVASVDASETMFTDTYLYCESDYTYAIRAVTADGSVSPHTSASISTADCPTIPPVTDLTATQISNDPIQIEVTWNHSDSASIAGFDIDRSGPDDYNDFDNLTPLKTSYTDSDFSLRCDTDYEYIIWAYDADFYSDAEVFDITTAACDAPELTITASGPANANPGDEIDYTLTVANSGSTSVPYLILYDVLPENAEFISATDGGAFNSTTGEVLWELGALAPGESQSVELTLQANQDINHTTYGVLTEVGRNFEAFKGQPVSTQIGGDDDPDVQVCADSLNLPVTRFSPASSYLLSTPHDETSNAFPPVSPATDDKSQKARQAEVATLLPLEAIKRAQARRQERAGNAAAQVTSQALITGMLVPQAQGEGTINGEVQLESGTPASQATVCGYWEGSDEPGDSLCVFTNAQGNFTLTGLNQNAYWLIKPVSDDHYYSPPWDYADAYLDDVSSYSLPNPLIVSITNLKGQFVLADGQNTPLTSTYGTIETLNADGEVDWEAGWWDFVTDEEGKFYAGRLPATTQYKVYLSDLPSTYLEEGYIPPQPHLFTIEPANSLTELASISVSKATKFITGRVTGPNGGVAGVEIDAIREDDIFDYQYTYTDEDGYYSIAVNGGVWSVEPYLYLEDDNGLLFTGTAETVQFTEPAGVTETQTADFALEEPSQFITGQVVLPGGTPFTGTAYSASIDIWDVENGRYDYRWLNADGTFSIPAPDGFYEITLWVDEYELANYAGGAIPSQQVQGESLNLGNISLVPRFGTISGQVTDSSSNQGVPYVFVDVWEEKGSRWFFAQTDENGNYSVNVPPGEWQVAAYPWDEEYVAEEGTKEAAIKASDREATVNFKFTRADQRLTGRFVDANDNLVDVEASVYLARTNTGKQIVSHFVDRGEVDLPLPNDCEVGGQNPTCQIGVNLAPNADHTITDGPNIGSDGTSVTFTVRENDASITGGVLDPATMQPVSNLNGIVTLTPTRIGGPDATTAVKSAAIINGSYRLTNVGTGDFTLDYELETEPEEVLALDKFLPNPISPFEGLEIQAGDELTRDIVLEEGESFEIAISSDDGQYTGYYPAVISCTHTTFTVSNPDWLQAVPERHRGGGRCKRKRGGRSKCGRRRGGLLISQLLSSQPDRFNLEQYLFNDVTSESCQVEFGNAAANSGSDYMNPPARAINIGQGDITLQARRRDSYLVGQVFDQNGQLIRDGSVELVAYSQGGDGQVERMMTDANGCYRLHVSQTDANWSVTAAAERDGFYQTATGSISSRAPNAQAVIFGPQLQLASTGVAVIPAETHTFDSVDTTSYEFALSQTQKVHVNVPARAMPTNQSDGANQGQVTLSISPIAAPDTSFYQLIGNAINIKFIGAKQTTNQTTNQRNGSELSAAFRRSVSVELPYNATELAAQGISPGDLSVAQFSYQNNHWTPIASFTVDQEAQVVKLKLNRAVDALAIVVPTNEEAQTTGNNLLYLPLVER